MKGPDQLQNRRTQTPPGPKHQRPCFSDGEPALLNDPSGNPQFFSPFEERSGFDVRNEIIVPLNTREKTIGVIVVMNKKTELLGRRRAHSVVACRRCSARRRERHVLRGLLNSYRELEDLNRVKSKILNHLSHELRTRLPSFGHPRHHVEKAQGHGTKDFDRPIERMNRHVQSLNRLEAQVESIMITGVHLGAQVDSRFSAKGT